MKIAMTLILGVAMASAFADCCKGGGCGSGYYKASALSKSDAEFLAMANAMAAKVEGKAAGCCAMKSKSAKKVKGSKKVAMAAKSCCQK